MRDSTDARRYWNIIIINKQEHVVDLLFRPALSYAITSDEARRYLHALSTPFNNPFLSSDGSDYDTTADSTSLSSGVGRQRTMESINLSEDLELVSKLGSGSFGDVWRASLAGFTCAVKILRTGAMTVKGDTVMYVVFVSLSNTTTEQTRVVSEVALLQELDHANIVRYLGREIRANDDLLILMEYVPHSLYEAIRRAKRQQRRRFVPREVAMIVGNIARGLYYLHNLRVPVIHRDLKSKVRFVGCTHLLSTLPGRTCLLNGITTTNSSQK